MLLIRNTFILALFHLHLAYIQVVYPLIAFWLPSTAHLRKIFLNKKLALKILKFTLQFFGTSSTMRLSKFRGEMPHA